MNTVEPAKQQVLPPWGDSVELTDKNGRKLAFRAINALEQSRAVLFVGAEAAMNAAYMTGFVMPVMSIRAIDSEPVPIPNSQRELDALIQKLDDAGIGAVLSHIMDDRRKAAEDEQVKNSQGTPNS